MLRSQSQHSKDRIYYHIKACYNFIAFSSWMKKEYRNWHHPCPFSTTASWIVPFENTPNAKTKKDPLASCPYFYSGKIPPKYDPPPRGSCDMAKVNCTSLLIFKREKREDAISAFDQTVQFSKHCIHQSRFCLYVWINHSAKLNNRVGHSWRSHSGIQPIRTK